MQQVRWLHLSKVEQLLYVEDLSGHLIRQFNSINTKKDTSGVPSGMLNVVCARWQALTWHVHPSAPPFVFEIA